jgi:hypothetical protein
VELLTLSVHRDRFFRFALGSRVGSVVVPVVVIALAHSSAAHATPLQAHGQAGLVGDYQSGLTAKQTNYQAIRMPFSLTVEGKASSKVSLFLNLSPSFNLFPNTATELGNDSTTDVNKRQTGSETYQPLSNRYRAAEVLKSSYAYVNFASDVGLLTFGRVPRHWGLGLWKNAQWRPDAGAISTSDMVGLTLDFSSSLSGSVAFEKMNEGSPSVVGDDGDAFTIEAMLADDPSDPSSSGLAKRIGLTFSSYRHPRTETELSILDMFGQFYFSNVLLEGEMLYPTGNTRSTSYALSGGDSTSCADARNPDKDDIGCERKSIEGFGALLRMRLLVGGGESQDNQSWSSVASVDAARKNLSTVLSPESHEIGAEVGFARGDSDSFKSTNKDNAITGLGFHPNIRPSLIMFGSAQPLAPGFPGAVVQNVFYTKVNYTYETPGFGLISPSLIWAQLNKTAGNGPDVVDGTAGRKSNLGIEVNLDYSYRTTSRVDFGVTAGALIAGDAYTIKTAGTEEKAKASYGIRTTVSTSF